MCEFNIKRIDAVNSNTEKDRRGCYKRGDIISIVEDGGYSALPHLTVLAVPGLDHAKVEKLMEGRQELADVTVHLTEEEFQTVKDMVNTVTYNDKEYTVYMRQYVNPQLVSNIDGIRTYTAKELSSYQRRRFNIPENIMISLFPDGVQRAEVTKAVFLNHLENLLDKTFGINISETTWRQAFIDAINQ